MENVQAGLIGREGANRAERIAAEARVALGVLDAPVLAEWGVFSARLFGRALRRRLLGLGRFLGQLAGVVASEAVGIARARARGVAGKHLAEHAREGMRRARVLAVDLRKGVSRIPAVVERLAGRPGDVAPEILGLTAGFFLGSGGFDADGGIPDMDLALGIGNHRSVLTHSIIAGSAAEAAILSTFVLSRILHSHLPADRDPLWDRLMRVSERFSVSLLSGTSLGLAYHLGLDATLDGATALKGLPWSLSLDAHRAIVGLSALAEALVAASVALPSDGPARRGPSGAETA